MIVNAILFSWSIYNFVGIVEKACHLVSYGRSCFLLIKKSASYFAGKNKKHIDLNDSILIEKSAVENNWQLIDFFRIEK